MFDMQQQHITTAAIGRPSQAESLPLAAARGSPSAKEKKAMEASAVFHHTTHVTPSEEDQGTARAKKSLLFRVSSRAICVPWLLPCSLCYSAVPPS